MAWIGLHDSYVAWKHGYVRLGRNRTRKLYRTDNPRLFRINVVANGALALAGVVGVGVETAVFGGWRIG